MALKILLVILIALSILPALWVGIVRGRFYFPFLLLLAFYTIALPLQSVMEGFSPRTIVVASLFAAACNLLLSVTLGILDKKMLPAPGLQRLDYELPFMFEVVFMSLAALFAFLMLLEGLNVAFLDVWSQRSIGGGIISSVRTYTVFALFCLWPTLRSKWAITLAIPVLVFGFMTTGARAVLFAGVGFIIFWAMVRVPVRRKLLLMPVGLAAAFTLHIVSRVIRGVGLGALASGSVDYRDVFDLSQIDFTGGEGEIPKTLLFAVESVSSGIWDFQVLVTLRRLFFFYLPTVDSLSFLKPRDLTYELWEFAYLNGYFNYSSYLGSLRNNFLSSQSGSLHPTIWGDGLLNMSWGALFVWPALLAILLVFVEKFLSKGRMIVDPRIFAGAAAPAVMYVVRGNVYLGMLMFVVGGVLAYAVTQVARPIKNPAAR